MVRRTHSCLHPEDHVEDKFPAKCPLGYLLEEGTGHGIKRVVICLQGLLFGLILNLLLTAEAVYHACK